MRFRLDKEPTVDIDLNYSGCQIRVCQGTDSEDEENDDVQIRNFNEESDGRFLFIYQFSDRMRICRKYAPYLILLDTTYRTTKYALPLYFLVVKTNVN